MHRKYQEKMICGSVPSHKLPRNLTNYSCQLVVEEYEQENRRVKYEYLQFIARAGNEPSFTIEISETKQPTTLMHIITLSHNNQNNQDSAILGKKVDHIMICKSEYGLANKPKIKVIQDEEEDDLLKQQPLDFGGGSQSEDSDSQEEIQSLVDPQLQKCKTVREAVISLLKKSAPRFKGTMNELIEIIERQAQSKINRSEMKNLLQELCEKDSLILKKKFRFEKEGQFQGKKKIKE